MVKKPVLFVHGFIDFKYSPWWFLIQQKLRKYNICVGDECTTLKFGNLPGTSVNSPQKYARFIRNKVNNIYNNYNNKVCIISHSLGGLSSRYYLEFLNGNKRVDSLVTIGTPHKGTKLGYLVSITPAGRSILPNSRLLKNKLSNSTVRDNVNYLNIWSPSDLAVVPAENASLRVDKDNVKDKKIENKNHISLIYNSASIDVISNFVKNNCD